MVRELAITQVHRVWRVGLVVAVAATAAVHHVVGSVAGAVAGGAPERAEAMAGAYDRLSDGEPVEYLNNRL